MGLDPATGLPYRTYTLKYPDVDILGIYANCDLPLGVLRTEVVYTPNRPYNTFDMSDTDAIIKQDHVKYLIGWDLTGKLFFDWHKTAPFDITIEHIGEWVPDADDLQYFTYSEKIDTFNPSFTVNIKTNWFYELITTDFIASYSPTTQSGFLLPSISFAPSWHDKMLSLKLQYINVFGESDYTGMGILRQKDLVVLTTQINW